MLRQATASYSALSCSEESGHSQRLGLPMVVSLRAFISQQRLWSILAAKNPEKLIDLPA